MIRKVINGPMHDAIIMVPIPTSADNLKKPTEIPETITPITLIPKRHPFFSIYIPL